MKIYAFSFLVFLFAIQWILKTFGVAVVISDVKA